ncbi:hypothetical protein [Lysinibacillus sp. Ag94]|uniref:hypothetical protein n=1 Tax=Lysinibacillus sp. Ag94 TaxID=2936682 RepID=UPI00200E3CED|nr:hypothetical protein [Lysinibacillus sp. Ag94]UPW82640.1 hypothetical protein MY533_18250 [Lysinibacillus sp. Ag94]
MAILKDYSTVPSNCEVEINLKLVNEESIEFRIDLRSGPAFPEAHMEIACLKRDFLKLLDDLQHIDNIHLSMLEFLDPGLCIYHIPEYGTYHFPGYGLFQIPEQERQENEPRIKLIFVLDAGYKNHLRATGCGPSLCLIVKMEQITEFVNSLKQEMDDF